MSVKGQSTKKVSGRPPKSISDEMVHKLGQELVEWIRARMEGKKPPYHLTEWYFLEKNMLYSDWDDLRLRKDFRQYYDLALEMMTLATMQNEKLSTAYGSRFLGVYSKDLRNHEKMIKEENAEIERNAKSKEVINITPEEMEYNRSIISGLVALQNRNNE